ncbi:MAG: relaxase, partial [Chryseobacterium taeanense]
HMANGESNFKRQLLEQGINVVVRRNNEGRVYGITIVDHESRSVWNGSQLGKNLSANVFNDWWNKGIKINSDTAQSSKLSPSPVNNDENDPFGFLTPIRNGNIFEALGSLLPDSQDEDYEERDFENRMKKKRKRNRGT